MKLPSQRQIRAFWLSKGVPENELRLKADWIEELHERVFSKINPTHSQTD